MQPADLSLRARTTLVLQSTEAGDPVVLDRLLPLLYDELREIAHRQLTRERSGHTLSTTALVHEAYLRLVDETQVTQRGRAYFFAAAARAMRRILVDYARRRRAAKRGAGAAPVPLDDAALHLGVDGFAEDLVALDDALEQLSALNPRHARVVECRFFADMSVEETAEVLGLSARTVKYDWALARAWLYEALHGSP